MTPAAAMSVSSDSDMSICKLGDDATTEVSPRQIAQYAAGSTNGERFLRCDELR
jgi:hypothetical protein